MVNDALLSEVKSLSAVDRLELIEAVWQTLPPCDIAVTAEEKTLLDARLQEIDISPDEESPWPEVQKRLRGLL